MASPREEFKREPSDKAKAVYCEVVSLLHSQSRGCPWRRDSGDAAYRPTVVFISRALGWNKGRKIIIRPAKDQPLWRIWDTPPFCPYMVLPESVEGAGVPYMEMYYNNSINETGGYLVSVGSGWFVPHPCTLIFCLQQRVRGSS